MQGEMNQNAIAAMKTKEDSSSDWRKGVGSEFTNINANFKSTVTCFCTFYNSLFNVFSI